MIVLLDTSTPTCRLTVVGAEKTVEYEWLAERTLAQNLLGYLKERLAESNMTLEDISAIGVMQGPGSFTGLRIGLTVMNAIADSQQIPIVGRRGETWQEEVFSAIREGVNDRIVLPFYGSEAHITAPRK